MQILYTNPHLFQFSKIIYNYTFLYIIEALIHEIRKKKKKEEKEEENGIKYIFDTNKFRYVSNNEMEMDYVKEMKRF